MHASRFHTVFVIRLLLALLAFMPRTLCPMELDASTASGSCCESPSLVSETDRCASDCTGSDDNCTGSSKGDCQKHDGCDEGTGCALQSSGCCGSFTPPPALTITLTPPASSPFLSPLHEGDLASPQTPPIDHPPC